jgi:uncharacterized protein with ParB-like and HNH nuclease domain
MPKIHAHEHPIRQIFSNEFAFTIPSYQRPYSWGVEQTTELFSDLLVASEGFSPEAQRTKPEATPYFLGSIVLIKTEQTPVADVIDGQQRLTTIALLLSALKVSFEGSKQHSTFANLLFEEGNQFIGTKDRCRLTLRDRDHDFFEKNILRHDKLDHLEELTLGSWSDPQRKIAENAAFLVKKVHELSTESRDALAAYLLQHTYLVVVSTPDLESAFRIFSVLNDRGLDLTAADILKAEIIGKIAEDEQQQFVKAWEDAEENLGTARFAELFSNLRMIHAKNKQRKSILDEVRESIPLLKNPKRFIQEELVPSSESYGIILSHDYESTDKKADVRINRSLRFLARLDDSDWVPAALSYLTRFSNSPQLVDQFLAGLERLGATMWLRNCDVNDRIRRHSLLLSEIESGKDLTLGSSALQITEKEINQTIGVLDGDIYNLSSKKKRTMILLRLDEVLSSGEASYEFDRITVEHVLPQNPDQESVWHQWWPDSDEQSVNVHRIGNLALLNRRQNSAASNWDFEKKKTKYFGGKSGSSPFPITTEVLKKSTWTPEDFNERQSRFVGLLTNEWRLSILSSNEGGDKK